MIAPRSGQTGGVSDPSDLADFLRARREALQPADVGLPDSGRRRTPGLRREEVATLAGVSIDYLVRLEQGRDVHPSAGVLAALAQALRLSDDERSHLAKLGLRGQNSELCPTASPLRHDVAPTVRQILESLGPTPAFVAGPANDILAWNQAWEQVVAPFGMLDGQEPNTARFVFADPRARTVFPDWSVAADDQVSRLRTAELEWGGDDHFIALLDELRQDSEFATRWLAHAVSEPHRGVMRLRHPDAGDMRLAYDVLALPDDGEQRLVTWLPADEATGAALQVLLADTPPASPAQLRVVGS
jgi:transcriptional regulator with XRE-family HTH domain